MNLEAQIIEYSRKPNVSDLHVTEGLPLWYRESGQLKRHKHVITREEILDFLQKHQDHTLIPVNKLDELLNKRGDLDFATSTDQVRWRGNLYRSDNRKLVMALRKLESKIPKLGELGLPDTYMELPQRAKGLLLVTGPTGSGKTTTMASTIDFMNETTRRHIITLEDPVEFIHQSNFSLIHQRQMGGRDAKDFAGGLRAAMREDPDVIFIGEMRDRDTVQVALDAANTGHLVLATLHTMGARNTIERITSFFPADEKDWVQQVVSSVLVGVMSQVLVPRTNGKGGRALAYELLINTSQVRNAIREGKVNQIFNAMDTGRSDGQVLMNRCLADMTRSGEISQEDAMFYSYDSKQLEKELANG
jgi:twitching motility protein PilT